MCLLKRMMMMSNTDMRLRDLLPLSFIKSILRSRGAGNLTSACRIIPIHLTRQRIYFPSPLPSLPGHPHFFNQLSCGLDTVSMAGEWLTATANTNMFTYEIAPVFILMENVVLSKMREIIGYTGGDSILAPGGSISNLYAFLAARHKMFPGYKEHGPRGLPGDLAMFTSDQCHYSVKSCASVCGLGTENCVMVPSDEHGRMIPSELERLILERKARGQIPFFVNATAGTTVLGAFDPLNEIADICQKYNCWFHIDVSHESFDSKPLTSAIFFSFLPGRMGWRVAAIKEAPKPSLRRS
jgi:Pyridoxal-dependent decarboxylase conserved domain